MKSRLETLIAAVCLTSFLFQIGVSIPRQAAQSNRTGPETSIQLDQLRVKFEPTSHTGPDVIPPPLIAKLPSAVTAEHDFTEWPVDYLPR